MAQQCVEQEGWQGKCTKELEATSGVFVLSQIGVHVVHEGMTHRKWTGGKHQLLSLVKLQAGQQPCVPAVSHLLGKGDLGWLRTGARPCMCVFACVMSTWAGAREPSATANLAFKLHPQPAKQAPKDINVPLVLGHLLQHKAQ